MEDLSEPNANLVGLFVEFVITGKLDMDGQTRRYFPVSDTRLPPGIYFVYVAQCFMILKEKVRNGMPRWLPVAHLIIFLLALSVRRLTNQRSSKGGREVDALLTLCCRTSL